MRLVIVTSKKKVTCDKGRVKKGNGMSVINSIQKEIVRGVLWGLVFLIINLLSYSIILPFAQFSVNGHMNAGRFTGAIYFAIAIASILFFNSSAKRSTVSRFTILISTSAFIYWGWKLFHLHCEGCMISG